MEYSSISFLLISALYPEYEFEQYEHISAFILMNVLSNARMMRMVCTQFVTVMNRVFITMWKK